MGEVYRARDERLRRDIAIKVLPASLTQDADRLRRFEQEAQAAGALNHPNITAVYDIGQHEGSPYVVQELLEGETLRSELASGKLPPRRAIDYAVQIARGLSAAHEKGIVHRDLKPENLFITKDGRVKILDFGLAKLTQSEHSGDGSSLPTAAAGTEPGVVLGTLGYMSPEQVKGRSADARSDIFSFGAILYEMLSGNRAFRADSAAETMSAILKEDPPDLSVTSGNVSPSLERIVRHCLEKNPERRFQSTSDVAFDLEALSGVSAEREGAAVAAAPQRRGRLSSLAIALLASATALVLGLLVGRRTTQTEPPSYHRVTFRQGTVSSARFAPDGQTVLYSASWDGKPPTIYIKRPESPDAVSLELPSAEVLAISPSGELAIQLDRQSSHEGVSKGRLARAALTGGAAREIAENVNQVDWGPGGSLVVARDVAGKGRLECPLGKVLYETPGHVSFPRFSPRRDLIAFIDHPLPADDRGSIALIDLSGKKRTLSKEWGSAEGLAWSPSGDEVWFTAATGSEGRSLYGVSLSGRLRTIARMAGDLRLDDVTNSGRVLLAREESRVGIKSLRAGESQERELSWLEFSLLTDLSPDGKTMVFSEQGEAAGPNYSVCLRGTDGSPVVRLGEGQASGLSPDGKWVISQRLKPGEPIVLLPTGPGEPKSIDSPGLRLEWDVTWFPDGGRVLLTAREAGRGLRLYVQSLDGGKPRPISPEGVSSGFLTVKVAAISPDGTLVAAVGPSQKIMLFPVGNGDPRPVAGVADHDFPVQWSADGRSLYVGQLGELSSPARVFRLDLETGKRELWKELFPADSAGVDEIYRVCVTPDGRAYAYSYRRVLSELYVVEGLK